MTGKPVPFFFVLLCCAAAHAFREPDPRDVPLALFDIRTQAPTASESSGSTVSAEVNRGLKILAGSTSTTVHARFNPATRRPRNLFSLTGRLSGPSTRTPAEIARSFLYANNAIFGLSRTEVIETTVADEYVHPAGDSRLVVLQQRFSNLDVFGARIQFVLDTQGRVIQVAGNYHSGLQSAGTAQLTALQAIQWATAHCDPTRARSAATAPNTTLRLSVSPARTAAAASTGEPPLLFEGAPFLDPVSPFQVIMPVGVQAIPAWEMTLHMSGQECYLVVVDARNGALLYRTNLYKFAQPSKQERSLPGRLDRLAAPAGLVFTRSPDAAPREEVSFVGDPPASPPGWCDGTSTTQGNNVVACEDADGNNEKTPGIQPFSANRQFLYSFTNSWADSHTTGPDVNAVVTNLFYFCNWYHDYLYALGFNEASGNFQQDNFGRGGLGRDRVYADALDGSGFNNSTFLTWPDGDQAGRSRLQMFLFKPVLPIYPLYRDGDLDGDIVLHEYTHGMTARMVGGPSNVHALETLQAESLAEGWSDFFPCSVFDDPVIGEYVTGNKERGARHAAYNTHPWRYESVGRTFEVTTATLPGGGPFAPISVPEAHADGEIWAAALWALRTELGNPNLAEYLVVEALRYTPPEPTMLDGRDAILLADITRFQGAHHAAIWRAFARRGMGWSAETEIGPQAALVFQAFDWPPAFGGSFTTGPVIFSDTAESSSGWTVRRASGGQAAFHLSKRRRVSGLSSWYFGLENVWNYNTGSREWSALESPRMFLPTGAGYLLEFKHWRKAEDARDWSLPGNYFDSGIIYVRIAGTNEYHELGFSFHNTAGWETRRLDLSGFAGRAIQVGFYFDTWDFRNNNYEGWYIDDVKVLRTQTINAPPTSARPGWNAYP